MNSSIKATFFSWNIFSLDAHKRNITIWFIRVFWTKKKKEKKNVAELVGILIQLCADSLTLPFQSLIFLPVLSYGAPIYRHRRGSSWRLLCRCWPVSVTPRAWTLTSCRKTPEVCYHQTGGPNLGDRGQKNWKWSKPHNNCYWFWKDPCASYRKANL